MRTSEAIDQIATALAKAQGAMKNATLNKVNPHFKSKYADLAGIRDAVTPALSAHGLSVVQALDQREDALYLVTRLSHSSGQWLESACPIPVMPDMQKLGSAITYARRYGLSAICCIAADEDDDANSVTSTNGQAKAHAAPDGFDAWLLDLEATAPEGTAALEAVWKKSQPFLRQHLIATDKGRWERLKAKAAAVRQPELSHA